MDSIITLSEAKTQGLRFYFTGQPCKHGHIAKRKVSDRGCVECRKHISSEYGKRDRKKNPGKNAARCRQNYKDHREDYIRRAREWEKDNPERSAELQREWRRSDKGKAQSRNWVASNKETHAGYSKDWKRRNPDLVYEYTGTRRATKLNATPTWLTDVDRTEIRAIYYKAKQVTNETGILHVVDHIFPLRGENGCGLHVPWNLQIITQKANGSKGNKLIES